MDKVQDNNGCYNVTIQGIDRANTSTFQELCIFLYREFNLYDWYWYMAYTCAIDPFDDNFIFPEFVKTVFKISEYIIDSKLSHMFQKVYEHFYGIV